jgi:hypothetical protein
MKKNRLWVYLLINVIVSALTTISVLLIWDWAHQLKTLPISLTFPSNATPTASIEGTLPDPTEIILQIDNIYGVGQLQNEVIVIRRVGEGELWLTGWKLVDEQNHQYVFPRLSLDKGEINVHTQAGVDTVRDLHWGLSKSVWTFGEKVSIIDPLGNLRAEYTIP